MRMLACRLSVHRGKQMKCFAILIGLVLFLLLPASVVAAECQFVLGFKTLRDLIGHDIVGECLENERYAANGNSEQPTTGGLLVWLKADNWTAFTDGYRTWINGPNGLAQRLNTERFAWEADYAPDGGIATPTPIPESHRAERAIAALPWVQDGLRDDLERSTVDHLRKWAAQSPQVFWELIQSPWMNSSDLNISSSTSFYSELLVGRISAMVDRDPEVARQLIRMPFMQDISRGAFITWDILLSIFDTDRDGLYQLLEDPRLRRGIASNQGTVLSLLYLRTIDRSAADAVERLPRIHQQTEIARDLLRLYQTSRPIFWTWFNFCTGTDDYFPKDQYIHCPFLNPLITLAEIDEAIAFRIINMPFIRTWNQGRDGAVLSLAKNLAESDLAGLKQVLSHPRLAGGITDDHITTFELLVLGRERPAAAAAIEALPWVRDGVGRPARSNETSHLDGPEALEEDAVLTLASIARWSQDVGLTLVRKPWLWDGVSRAEEQVLIQLPSVIYWLDEASALQFVKMPFLQASVDPGDSSILTALVDMMTYSPNPDKREVLQEALADPLLRDGIKDGYRTRVEFVAIGKRAPEIAAAIYSLPWIQDGIDDSEWQAITVLHEASLRTPQLVPVLVSYPWAQDGLDRVEQDRVWRLMGEAVVSGPDPTPTPDIRSKVATAKWEISALRWVRDGIAQSPEFEAQTHRDLKRIAQLNPELVIALVRKPWLRDGLTRPEYQALRDLFYFARFDAAIALQLVNMPFLQKSLDWEDANTLDVLDSMLAPSANPSIAEVLREVFSDPLLRGGIKDGQRHVVEFLAIGQQPPEIATAIYSLPWIQDGIEGSEWEAMTVLYASSIVTQRSRFIPILVSYSWVQDGLTRTEQDRVRKLMRSYY